MAASSPGARRGGRRFVVGAIAVLAVVVWLLVRSVTEEAPDAAAPAAPTAEQASASDDPPSRVRAGTAPAAPAEDAPPEPEAEVVPDSPPDPAVRRVRVVDQDGVPVVGQVVAWTDGAKRRSRPTDARGVVEVPVDEADAPGEPADDETPDAPRGPARPGTVFVFDGEAERTFEVGWPTADVAVENLPLLDVVVVDGATGAPVAAQGARVTTWLGEDYMQADLAAADLAARRRLALGPGRLVDLRIDVDARDGYAALRGWACEAAVEPGVRVARVVVPVFRTTSLTVAALDDSGRLVAGAQVASVALLRTWRDEMAPTGGIDWAAAPDAEGRFVVSSLPAAPGNALRIDVKAEVEHARRPLVGFVTCPADGASDVLRVELEPGLRRDPSARSPETVVVRTAVGTIESGDLVEASSPLDLRVVRRDGTPAAGVHVVVAPEFVWYFRNRRNADGTNLLTDAEGRIRFDEAPRTRVGVQAWGAGFLPTLRVIDVAAGGEAVLREESPREVRVVVVDAQGRPRPCVRVTAGGVLLSNRAGEYPSVGIAQVRDGVDLLTPRTGADGAVTLTVPQGSVRYVAALAGIASIVESDEALVRIVLASHGD